MSNKTLQFIISTFVSLFLFSCTPNEEEFKNLDLTIVWERNLSSGSEVLDMENRTLYFENLDDDNLGMGALNIETGETLWLTKKIGRNSGVGVFDD